MEHTRIILVRYSRIKTLIWKRLGISNSHFFIVCLPVDVLILYTEPFGMEGTMVLIVLAFVPFLVILADCYFPEREALVTTLGRYRFIQI